MNSFRSRLEDKSAVQEAIDNSDSIAGALLFLGVQNINYYSRIFNQACETHNLVPNRNGRTGLPYINTAEIKKKLIAKGLLENKCSGEDCPIQTPYWLGSSITFQLDHINGDNTDNRKGPSILVQWMRCQVF